MPIKVLIPTPLRPYAGKQSMIEVNAKTVGEVLSNLVAQHPDLRRHLFSEDGKLRSFVNVYLNDEDIRYLTKDATSVKESDTVTIVPSVAGGIELADRASGLFE
ncbi:MAG: ubiquitin-like small modifier protein 1 [Terracidiphilus sp.]|jgi:adenylyltransferase/sulfurtransferase